MGRVPSKPRAQWTQHQPTEQEDGSFESCRGRRSFPNATTRISPRRDAFGTGLRPGRIHHASKQPRTFQGFSLLFGKRWRHREHCCQCWRCGCHRRRRWESAAAGAAGLAMTGAAPGSARSDACSRSGRPRAQGQQSVRPALGMSHVVADGHGTSVAAVVQYVRLSHRWLGLAPFPSGGASFATHGTSSIVHVPCRCHLHINFRTHW